MKREIQMNFAQRRLQHYLNTPINGYGCNIYKCIFSGAFSVVYVFWRTVAAIGVRNACKNLFHIAKLTELNCLTIWPSSFAISLEFACSFELFFWQHIFFNRIPLLFCAIVSHYLLDLYYLPNDGHWTYN